MLNYFVNYLDFFFYLYYYFYSSSYSKDYSNYSLELWLNSELWLINYAKESSSFFLIFFLTIFFNSFNFISFNFLVDFLSL